MSTISATDRRSFLKSSLVVATPIVAVATPAVAMAADDSAARLAMLDDERAIEAAQRAFLRSDATATLGETIRHIAPDHAADPLAIELAADGLHATARTACIAEIAQDFSGNTTLEQMARLQGNAAARHSQQCVVVTHFKKEQGQWMLTSAQLA